MKIISLFVKPCVVPRLGMILVDVKLHNGCKTLSNIIVVQQVKYLRPYS